MEKIEIDPERKKEIVRMVIDTFSEKFDTTLDGNFLTFKYEGVVFLKFDLYDFCQRCYYQQMILFVEQDMFDEMYKLIDVNFKDAIGLTQEEFQCFIACSYVCCEETHANVVKFIHDDFDRKIKEKYK